MGKNTITLFIAESCEPCQNVKEQIIAGHFSTNVNTTDLDFVDVETDEGYEQIKDENLEFVPVARYQGKNCEIHILEDETVFISCPVE